MPSAAAIEEDQLTDDTARTQWLLAFKYYVVCVLWILTVLVTGVCYQVKILQKALRSYSFHFKCHFDFCFDNGA